MPIPANHPQRFQLTNEVHARPYANIYVPARASHLAILLTPEEKAEDREALNALCERYLIPPPAADVDHFNGEFGSFQLRWEQHSEFTTYTFYTEGSCTDPFSETALRSVPDAWLESLPGQLIVAAHAGMMCCKYKGKSADERQPVDLDVISPMFEGNTLIGSGVAGGDASAFTDFRIHADGFSRILVIDHNFHSSRQAGRLLHRLFEIEVYRMMALLAFPVARKMLPELNKRDKRLVDITSLMSKNESDNPARCPAALLDELTELATEVENSLSSSHFRLGAAQAYIELVNKRIEDLREVRTPGLQTFREFMDRRLAPAMNTCHSVNLRQKSLSKRIAQAGQLLRTRVDVELERQNQSLLESMDKRAQLQLRLQETVEGLSVAAITYYSVSLVGYLAKAGKAAGLPLKPDLVMGISIPIIAGILIFGVRLIRKKVKVAHAKIDE
ncbi:MAG: DUF3422 domain-containing protein [Candidatus Polarisedimenticolaceae bacterium]|nr:DUF3422 domain-containing protein [Candidatus Polarisedimenticolaceae bacterium]